ncbi:hypothetical protein E3E28_03800 [Thermococcus sp. 21S9]|nr:hypothetical protein [Thermococcus sp. 21S9]
MNEFRVHNFLTFYLPPLILVCLSYAFLNKDSRAFIYLSGYLVTYLAIRLEIHHYSNRWGYHRDPKFVKTLVVSELVVLGFLLPTIFTYSTRATLVRNILIYLILSVGVFELISLEYARLNWQGCLMLSISLSIVIFALTYSMLIPSMFVPLALWACLVVRHDLKLYV